MEQSSSDPLLGAVTADDLAAPVRNALRAPRADVTYWRGELLGGGAGFIGSVYRFTGTAEDRGARVPWSLILKVIRGDANESPASATYWKREPLAYRSGVLQELPAGLCAPRCYGSVVTDDRAWLWLEDARDDLGVDWPVAHYGVVARHLGRLNGTYVGDAECLALPWLTTGWLADWVERVAPVMAEFPTAVEHPLFARIFRPDVADLVLRLWDARAELLGALARLPPTFCHLDAFRRNIVARRSDDGDVETVLLDWAFVGTGAIGEELAPLVAATVIFDGTADWKSLPSLDQLAFDGYVGGLRDVGWRGDRDQVRFAYTTASALRYCVGVTGFVMWDTDDRGRFVNGHGWADPENQADAEVMLGRPFDDLVEHASGVFGWLAELGEEALRLMPS